MDCSPPGSSVCGISQARILEWVAMPSSRGSSQYRDQNLSLLHCRQILLPLSHSSKLHRKSFVTTRLVFFFWKPQSESIWESRSHVKIKGKPGLLPCSKSSSPQSCEQGSVYLFSVMGHPGPPRHPSFYFPSHWCSRSLLPWFPAGPPSFGHRKPWRISPTSCLLLIGRKRSAAKENPRFFSTLWHTSYWIPLRTPKPHKDQSQTENLKTSLSWVQGSALFLVLSFTRFVYKELWEKTVMSWLKKSYQPGKPAKGWWADFS